MPAWDVAIVGGGIVGLATGMELLARFPRARVVLLEKEPDIARHQTAHNSGVIHSGLYYPPGSLKARTCVEGGRLMVEFCREHGIPHEICGKVVVAVEPEELPRLEELHRRGRANGVAGLSMIGPEQLRELEPHARGLKALHVASAGIVDFVAVARTFADLFRRRGGEIRTHSTVLRLTRRGGGWIVETTGGTLQADALITCGGLHEDRLAALAGAGDGPRIVPFRGDYYELIPERRAVIRHMIYPVPDPALPFLGVHFTRDLDGGVHVGPNAVLALKREGYRKTDVSLRDTLAMLGDRGVWRMARRYWRVGVEEWARSWSPRAFVRAAQRLVPEVRERDFRPAGSGVRAQAVDPGGSLVNDFDIVQAPGAVHVRNVPSPAATASIRIGQLIADIAGQGFGFM